MERVPATKPGLPRQRRLIWVLAALAIISTATAAYAWTRRPAADPPVPEQLSLQDLGAAELGAADPAPDFSVPTLDGGSFSLSRHLADTGKPVFLNLWASWCPPCRDEMPVIDAAAARHPEIEFVGVAVQDDNKAAEDFAREIGVGYTIGFDERDEVNARYQTFGLPVTYVISAEGTILQPIFGELDDAQIDAVLATWFGG